MTVFTRADWDEAAAAGFITAEHVIARIERIAIREFGFLGSAGYDEDGFFTSLTADGLRVEGGITLRVWPNDHPPPHVHIEVKSQPEVPIKIRLEDGEILGKVPPGWGKKLKRARQAVLENHDLLMEWWKKRDSGV